jgi:hypothetical protein
LQASNSVFKIRHIETNKFVKTGTANICIYNIITNDGSALTSSFGRTFSTRTGAENFMKRIPELFRDLYEIVEYKEQ